MSRLPHILCLLLIVVFAVLYGQNDAVKTYNRGNAWVFKGDADAAIKDYTKALRIDPKFEEAYYNRGVAWRSKGNIDAAIKDETEALRLDSKSESRSP